MLKPAYISVKGSGKQGLDNTRPSQVSPTWWFILVCRHFEAFFGVWLSAKRSAFWASNAACCHCFPCVFSFGLLSYNYHLISQPCVYSMFARFGIYRFAPWPFAGAIGFRMAAGCPRAVEYVQQDGSKLGVMHRVRPTGAGAGRSTRQPLFAALLPRQAHFLWHPAA